MATNSIALDVRPIAVTPRQAVSMWGWWYVGGSLLAMYFAQQPIYRLAVAAGMLFGLLPLKPLDRATVLVVLVLLISPPLTQDVGDPMYDAFLGNIVPNVSVSICEALFLINFLPVLARLRRFSEKRSRLDVLVAATAIAAVYGAVHGLAVRENASRQVLTEIRPFAGLFLGYFTARLYITTLARNRRFWNSICSATLLKCLHGLYLYYVGTGFSYQASLRVFADAELLFMLIALTMGCVEQLRAVRAVRLVAVATMTVFLVVSSSRFIWAAAALAMIAVLVFHRRHLRSTLVLGILLPVGVGAAIVFIGTSEGLASRWKSIFDWQNEPTNIARILEARNAWATIREQPFLGTGLGGEWTLEHDLVLGEGQFRASVFKETTLVHNAYLWTWLKLGLPGVALLVAVALHSLRLAVRSVRQCRPKDRQYAWGVLAGLGSFYLILLVGNWLLHPRCMIAWGVLLATAKLWNAIPAPNRRTA